MTMTEPSDQPPDWAIATLEAPMIVRTSSDVAAEMAGLYGALAKANGAMANPIADAEGQARGGKYPYASLAAVSRTIRGPLADAELAVLQAHRVSYQSNAVYVTVCTRLVHSSGHWLETELELAVGGNTGAQEVGSASTYARRYSLTALFALASDRDDDGAAAHESRGQRSEQQQPAPVRDPFESRPDALADGTPLVTRPVYDELMALAAQLTEDQRKELTAWRETQGIKITAATLTAEQAALVIDRIRPLVPDQEPVAEPDDQPADEIPADAAEAAVDETPVEPAVDDGMVDLNADDGSDMVEPESPPNAGDEPTGAHDDLADPPVVDETPARSRRKVRDNPQA